MSLDYDTRLIPVFLCSKCGAVCDVKHRPAVTELQWAQADPEVLRDYGFTRAALQAGYKHGEHLSLHCPRCSHNSRRPTLDAE